MSTADTREIEFKFLLDGEVDFARVAQALGLELGPASRQENRFFDTEDKRLGRERLALRLRGENGAYTLTAKGPREGGERPPEDESLTVRPELEVPVTPTQAQAICRAEADPLELMRSTVRAADLLDRLEEARRGGALLEMGAFVNQRWRLELSTGGVLAGLTLELDRTELPGDRVDHEIECEVPADRVKAVRPALETLLAELGLSWGPATSKLRRFLEALPSSSRPGP